MTLAGQVALVTGGNGTVGGAIARALAGSPRVLLADEPTGQLDTETGLGVMALLRAVVESEGVTAVVATHDPVLMSLADRVLSIADGRLDG